MTTGHPPVPAPSFEPTDGPKSERLLARSLGYPPTWHVVRVVPHPADADAAAAASAGPRGAPSAPPFPSFQDRIYAGDPRRRADLYYNHGAAGEAALRWVEGESTPFGDGGGQMLERVAKFRKGDRVEVYYEDDDAWYKATIVKKKEYEDDIRYTVHYTEEDTTQPNVSEEDIRPAPPKKVKKKEKDEGQTGKKRKAESEEEDGRGAVAVAAAASFSGEVDPLQAAQAAEIGLPAGWRVKKNKNYKLSIWGPDGKRYRSKRAAFDAAGIEVPAPQRPAPGGGRPRGRPRKRQRGGGGGEGVPSPPTAPPPPAAAAIEEGDPPWRTDGHPSVGRRVRYHPPYVLVEQTGTVTGWIADTDVDSAGEPGFRSERTGEPAALFHVTFDAGGLLESQDFEDYELEGLFVEEEEEDDDEDEGGKDEESDGSNSDYEQKKGMKKIGGDTDGNISEEGDESSSDNSSDCKESEGTDDDEVPLSSIIKKMKEKGMPKKKESSEEGSD